MRKKSILASLALASVSAIALVASACGDDDAEATADSGGATSSISGQMFAIQFIDTIGLHDIDVALNDEKTVPPTARTSVLKSASVLRNTEWAGELSASADALADSMVEFAEVLHADPVDMAKAGELAGKVHDDAHDLSHDAWSHFHGEAGVETGEDSHGD